MERSVNKQLNVIKIHPDYRNKNRNKNRWRQMAFFA